MGSAGRVLLCLALLLAVTMGARGGVCEAQEQGRALPESVRAVRDTVWLSQAGEPVGVRVERGLMTSAFRRGGPVMYGILACSLAGVAIIIMKLLELRVSRVVPSRVVKGVGLRWSSGDIAGATALTQVQESSIGRVLRAGLAKHEWGRAEVLRAMESAGGREETALGRYLRVLGALAAISPLLGILGTVLGMIKAFNVIAASGSRRPDLIASGISEALITTAFGLLVAIPLYLFFHYLRGRVERLLTQMEEVAEETVRNVGRRGRVPEQGPPPHATQEGAGLEL
jgi:biopolymer transport protein ExbB